MKKLINLRVIDQFWRTPSVSFEGCSRAQGSCRTCFTHERIIWVFGRKWLKNDHSVLAVPKGCVGCLLLRAGYISRKGMLTFFEKDCARCAIESRDNTGSIVHFDVLGHTELIVREEVDVGVCLLSELFTS